MNLPHVLSLGATLAAVWLLLSGHYEPLILALGACSIAVVIRITHRMDAIDQETHPIHLAGKALSYFPWLLWEIVKANIDVAKVIIDPKLPIGLRILRVDGSQQTDIGLVTYANSITLTPGTVTIWDEGTRLDVHALTPAAADGLLSGEMDRRVTNLEGAGALKDGDAK